MFILTLSQTTIIRLFQTGRVSRRQFQICWKWQRAPHTSRKHCRKRRNCSLRAISCFPKVFSKDLYCIHVKNKGLFGNEKRQFSQTTIFTFFKLKEFADDIFKFHEKDRKVSKRVENIAGKGEIARYEQFLLFPQRFQKTFTADTSNPGPVWKRINLKKNFIDFHGQLYVTVRARDDHERD